jgi:uncharacterized protein
MSKFVLFKDSAGQWRFNLQADNGEIVSQSEAYHNRKDAEDTIAGMKDHFPDASVELSDTNSTD